MGVREAWIVCLSQAPDAGGGGGRTRKLPVQAGTPAHRATPASAEMNHFKVHNSVAFSTLHGWATAMDLKF